MQLAPRKEDPSSRLTTSVSFIWRLNLVRHVVSVMLRATAQIPSMLVLAQFHEPLTVGKHNGSDDQAEDGPKVPEENVERNRNIGQGWDDVEQQELENMVDCGAAVEDAENFSSPATSVPCKGQVKNVVEAELGHGAIRVLHNWSPEDLNPKMV